MRGPSSEGAAASFMWFTSPVREDVRPEPARRRGGRGAESRAGREVTGPAATESSTLQSDRPLSVPVTVTGSLCLSFLIHKVLPTRGPASFDWCTK